MTCFAPRPALLLALALLPGCLVPLLDSPPKVRQRQVHLPPLYSSARSEDGSSFAWSAAFWLVGQDVEESRRHTRVLPFYWHEEAPPYREKTVWFPFFYEERTAKDHTRFLFPLLSGSSESDEMRSDFILVPLYYARRSKTTDYHRSGLALVYDWEHRDGTDTVSLFSLFGLATLAHLELGLPAEGVRVGAQGRSASRRVEIGNVLGAVSLFGYDDVGDTRDVRFLTVFGSEVFSLFRSWRSRGDDPFVREWLFPVYMNVADESGGFSYVGPLWGSITDTEQDEHTDWWALGLLSRTRSGGEEVWKVLGVTLG